MGFLPQLSELNTSRDMVSEFGGYNHNLRINGNEFYDMQNMSAARYPVLSPRSRRGKLRTFTKPNGLYAHEKLCWVDGTAFYYDGEEVDGLTLADSAKTIIGMGAYILIWPDKKYYNTSDGSFGDLGNTVTTSGTVNITLCKNDGVDYGSYTASSTAPSSPTNGQLWVDTSNTPHVLKQYSSMYGTWQPIPTTYVKIAATGIGVGFSKYDGVTISGMDNTDLNGDFILYGAGDDYIIITAIIDAVATQSSAATIARIIPDMDYVTESENRVWGCSSAAHEIYACKLGDPKNWNCFMGVSTDSYTMTVGSSGDFTGCCTHLGYVLFFKADVIHKIYGNKPSNFQLTNTHCRGVEKGSEKSLVIVNETLYYKSRHDVCAYNSSLPASISDALGSVKYKNAVAGALASKYYICLEDDNGTFTLFVFDEAHGLWHKEDNTKVTFFAAYGAELYYINDTDKGLYTVGGDIITYADTDAAVEAPIAWSAETGDIGMEYPDSKYISKLQFRLEVPEKSIVRIELQYDCDGIWVEKYRINATRKRSFTVPIIPKRCDTMKIRISGTGDCNIYSLTKTIEQGSDM